jgi:hypothetical protein
LLLSFPALSGAQEKQQAIDPKADSILRQMSEHLNTLPQFSVHVENSLDILLSSGQKLQMGRAGDIFVRRPDRIHANMKGDRFNQEFFYDGKSITLFTKNLNYYATIKAPSNIEEAVDLAEESVGLVAPIADLIYRNCYDILIQDVQSGFYVGLSTVLGVECHHLAFRGEETDWQIWIQNSAKPLPRKFIITSKWVAGAPQFTAFVTNWNVSPQLKDSLFTFVKPEGAQKFEFLSAEN